MTNVLHQVNQAGAPIFRIKWIKIHLDFLQTADKGHFFMFHSQFYSVERAGALTSLIIFVTNKL